MSVPPVTNPDPAEVLQTFLTMGTYAVPMTMIAHAHIRVLVSRGLHLAGITRTEGEEQEFAILQQELADRLMGRDQVLK